MKRVTVNLTNRAESAVDRLQDKLDCDQTAAINKALILTDYLMEDQDGTVIEVNGVKILL